MWGEPVQAHPFFAGVRWESLTSQPAPYVPTVTHELDTQVRQPCTCKPYMQSLAGCSPPRCALTAYSSALNERRRPYSAAPLCTIAYLWVLPLEATSLAARWAQNFEAYEGGEEGTASSEGRGRWARADPNFIGYTYKAWEAVSPPPGL